MIDEARLKLSSGGNKPNIRVWGKDNTRSMATKLMAKKWLGLLMSKEATLTSSRDSGIYVPYMDIVDKQSYPPASLRQSTNSQQKIVSTLSL